MPSVNISFSNCLRECFGLPAAEKDNVNAHAINKWNYIFPLTSQINGRMNRKKAKILISATLICIVSVTIKLCGNPLFNTEFTFLNYGVHIKLCCAWGNKE
jgi:hypothetical protein